jgi:hypothetical protein
MDARAEGPRCTETPRPARAKARLDTYRELVIYLRWDCRVCRSEGFQAQTPVWVRGSRASIIATLNVLHHELLGPADVSAISWSSPTRGRSNP